MKPRVPASPDLPVDPSSFRQVMGRLATGVTVVTTRCDDGFDHAMTANSFTSVSLDPLLVLVCVEVGTRFHAAAVVQRAWGVSVLDASAEPAARWFATSGRPLEGQLDRVAHHRGRLTGAALLDGALATLECRTTEQVEAGDHTIVIGEVLGLAMPDQSALPLLFWAGRFGLPHTVGRAARPA